MGNIHEHLLFDVEFFGYYYGQYKYIHHLIDHGDIDYVAVFGQSHRKFMHDQRMVDYITANYGIEAGMVAKGHLAIDKVWSYSKRHGSKKQI